MATHMQQTMTNVRRARLGNWMAGVASAVLLAGAIAVAVSGMGSQQGLHTSYAQHSQVTFGIDLPTGAHRSTLPAGITDYIR